MQPATFVKQLAAMAPSTADLEKSGLSREGARRVAKSCSCVKRTRPLEAPSGVDAVLELLRGWDLSNLQIGMVCFPDPPSDERDWICIGCVEADELVIHRKTGEVVVHELGTKGHILWRVSKNRSKLLDALIIAAGFLKEAGLDEGDNRDLTTAHRVALDCATAEGGTEYLRFYEMLVGAE
jgi:hypothetical protein